MSRTRSLTALGVVLLVTLSMATAPVAALSIGGFSVFEADAGDTLDQASYGADGLPSWIVTVEDGRMDALEDWTESSEDRILVSSDNTSDRAVVAASAWQVNAGFITKFRQGGLGAVGADQLGDLGYVKSIEPNYVVANVEPVESVINQSAFEVPQTGLSIGGYDLFGSDAFDAGGLVFNQNANTTTPADARDAIGVDNVSETGASADGSLAIIDTGINTANGRVFGNGTSGSDLRIANASKNFITNETVGDQGIDAVSDGNSHGTWAASAAAANHSNTTYDGAAPDADLLVLKALNDEGSGQTSHIVDAIRYAADHDAEVISLSLGSPVHSDALADAVQYARDQGSVVVVAAGNSRAARSPGIATPADVEGALAVGATNGSGPSTAGSAYFSQTGYDSGVSDLSFGDTRGANVDLAAPGMATSAQVPTTGGFVDVSELSGTSMATPYVSAAAYLTRAAHPSWDVNETETALLDGARPVPNAAVVEVGNGMVAADNAIDGVEPETSQEEAMTTEAQARQTYYEGASGGAGFDVGLPFGSLVPVLDPVSATTAA